MKAIKIITIALFLLFTASFIYSCSVVKGLLDLQKIQFKLDNVYNFRVANIGIDKKKSIKDFSISDGLNLMNAFKNKKLPADFILNVAAKNPNDGSGGVKSTVATLTSFDWKLYIDNVETIAGNIAEPVKIPGTGQTEIIPLTMSLDLFKFFGDRGYEGIINLAMALGGVNGSSAKLKLDAKPTVSTPIGPIPYPGRITIVDTQFTN
jgi:hypothetical protein